MTTTIFLQDGISLMLGKCSSFVTIESLFGRHVTVWPFARCAKLWWRIISSEVR